MNIENLTTLAYYLSGLPEGYGHFGMYSYNQDRESRFDSITRYKCGTTACAVGHGPYAGIPINKGERWSDYSERVFIKDRYTRQWKWCFSGSWVGVDDTAHGAAKRILYMLDRGVPNDFEGGEFSGLEATYTYSEEFEDYII